MKTILAIIKAYLVLSGFFINAMLILVVLLKPDFAHKAYEHGISILAAKAPGVLSVFQTPAKTYNLNEEIAQNFEPWKPLVHGSKPAKGIYIGTRSFSSLTRASASLRDGETLHRSQSLNRASWIRWHIRSTRTDRSRRSCRRAWCVFRRSTNCGPISTSVTDRGLTRPLPTRAVRLTQRFACHVRSIAPIIPKYRRWHAGWMLAEMLYGCATGR